MKKLLFIVAAIGWILWVNAEISQLNAPGAEWIYYDGFDSKDDCYSALKATGLSNEREVVCRPDGYDPNLKTNRVK